MKKVLVHGRFENLSQGQIEFLVKSKALGEFLIVALNDRQECEQPYEEREKALLSLGFVNEVVKEASLDVLKNIASTNEDMIVALGVHERELGEELEDIGVEVRYIFSGIADIPFLVVIVGQACTIKCRDCGNFSPYAPADTRQYSVDAIIRDLMLIINNCSKIDRLQIQGGEPFLHPHLIQLLAFLIEQDKVKQIIIASNGTISSFHQDLVEMMKNKKVFIRISNYNNVPKIRNSISKTEACLENNGIQNFVHSFTSRLDLWYQKGSIDTPRETRDDVVAERYAVCKNKHCLTLENSLLGYCSRSTIAMKVQKFSPKPNDYLTVEDSADFRQKLCGYVTERHFMEACRFCYGTSGEMIDPAIQLD